MKRVVALKGVIASGARLMAGEVYEISDSDASILLAGGHVALVKEPAAEPVADVEVKVKRKRGRPRKSKSADSD